MITITTSSRSRVILELGPFVDGDASLLQEIRRARRGQHGGHPGRSRPGDVRADERGRDPLSDAVGAHEQLANCQPQAGASRLL